MPARSQPRPAAADAALPAELLGPAYEQALAKQRPALRKAGGVYYTPAPLVDYVVPRALAPLLAGQTPCSVASRGLRIVDPSCGGGSFLLGAYRHLLDWHLGQYVAEGPRSTPGTMFHGSVAQAAVHGG